LLSLARIEARYLVLRDQSYEALWEERVARTYDDLQRLRAYTMSPKAAAILEGVLTDFGAYRRVVAREHELFRGGKRSAALSLATQQVATGAFREPIVVRGTDEVTHLADAFNAMAVRLRRVDEMKEEFFATISHELRSPLTSVREAAHLLRDGVPGEMNAKQ